MKLYLDRLGPVPAKDDYEASAAWWQDRSRDTRLPEYDYVVTAPFRFALDAHKMGQNVHLSGSLGAAIEVECSRCVKRYGHALRDSFRLVLEPAGSRVPADPEGARALGRDGMCLGEELEAGWYRGGVIDLGSFFAEVVALAMPFQPMCSEDCRGLCPRCGVDRNLASCSCPEDWKPDSPFAVLAQLKDGQPGD